MNEWDKHRQRMKKIWKAERESLDDILKEKLVPTHMEETVKRMISDFDDLLKDL